MDAVFTVVTIWLIILVILVIVAWWIKRLLNACVLANLTEWGNPWLNCLDGLNRLFCQYYHRLEYIPIELPKQGPAVIVANHLSGLDPLLLFAATRRPLHFLIAREQYERFGLRWLFKAAGCIPVDRSTRPERALRAAWRTLKAGEVIALFPQGKIVLPEELKKPLKRGGLWLAQHTQSPVYPVHLTGITGRGHIFRGILWRSQAKLVSYPPLIWTAESQPEQLQDLIEPDLTTLRELSNLE